MAIKFNFENIPSSASIKEATLKLYIHGYFTGYNNKSAPITIHYITKDWNENSVKWSQGWNNAGGDFENATIDTFAYTPGYKGWIDFDVTESVKKFMDNTLDNYGFMIGIMGGNDNTEASLYMHDSYIRSREYSNQDQRPVLVVDYDATSVKNKVKQVGSSNIFKGINLVNGEFFINSEYAGLITVNVTDAKGSTMYKLNSVSVHKGLNRFEAGNTRNATGVYFAVVEIGNSMKTTVKFIAK